MKPPVDFLGNEIGIGNVIAYPGRQGSSLWMNLGLVEEITEEEALWHVNPMTVLKVLRAGPDVTRTDEIKAVKTKTTIHGRVVVIPGWTAYDFYNQIKIWNQQRLEKLEQWRSAGIARKEKEQANAAR